MEKSEERTVERSEGSSWGESEKVDVESLKGRGEIGTGVGVGEKEERIV